MNSAFALAPDKPHSVVIVMNKVDPVYVSEAKNAFNGYNQENFYSLSLTAENASLNDSIKMVVIGNFPTDKAALDYLQNLQPIAPRQIVPWLPANKYTFLIISGPNLQLLLNNKDLNAYRQFLSAAYPGRIFRYQFPLPAPQSELPAAQIELPAPRCRPPRIRPA